MRGEAEYWEGNVTSELRICGATLDDGSACVEKAIVQAVHYYYKPLSGQVVPTLHVLREIHFRVDCPKCGDRLQVETAL